MDRERYIPTFEELRRECRQRWAEVRADWKDMLDEAAGFREHGDDEFADMALETAKKLRHKMRWVAAARVRRAAREEDEGEPPNGRLSEQRGGKP